MPEEAGLYPDLSAARTLDFYGRLYQVPYGMRAARTERLLTMLDLWDRRDARVRTFSKGMKQRLTIARALINDPPVLFLDEPTANLDPEGAKTVRDFLLQLKQEKRTILLNTHQLAEAERVCDRVGIMHTRLIAVGTPDGLRGTASQHATAIQLAVVTDAVVAAAQATREPRGRDGQRQHDHGPGRQAGTGQPRAGEGDRRRRRRDPVRQRAASPPWKRPT